jgi:hypothetical protein
VGWKTFIFKKIGRFLMAEEQQTIDTTLTKREADVTAREAAVTERENNVKELESEIETRMSGGDDATVLVPVPEHDHTFVPGLLPDQSKVRICTVPGCGLTEKVPS